VPWGDAGIAPEGVCITAEDDRMEPERREVSSEDSDAASENGNVEAEHHALEYVKEGLSRKAPDGVGHRRRRAPTSHDIGGGPDPETVKRPPCSTLPPCFASLGDRWPPAASCAAAASRLVLPSSERVRF
jgi:hypothetical protein